MPIKNILSDLNRTIPLDAACGGCLSTSLFYAARLGELTAPTLTEYSPGRHVNPTHVRQATDRNGFETTVIRIPQTKSNQIDGEDIYFSKQLGDVDPEDWFRNHITVNWPGATNHLFAYLHSASSRTIKKTPYQSSIHPTDSQGSKEKRTTHLTGARDPHWGNFGVPAPGCTLRCGEGN
ncbi:hypothetical protein GYMLUDRAFT_239114 [Collybiopsis luxurians FD-317 M1]|nr:hypothetical protein GYMLUDRAFT_239114 [Collybiopsis luxurians FD-317 M1]